MPIRSNSQKWHIKTWKHSDDLWNNMRIVATIKLNSQAYINNDNQIYAYSRYYISFSL